MKIFEITTITGNNEQLVYVSVTGGWGQQKTELCVEHICFTVRAPLDHVGAKTRKSYTHCKYFWY